MPEPIFLTTDRVLAIHADQLERYGGAEGVRDPGLLDSALAQPRAAFGGTLLHEDLAAQASAYAYHLMQNHPFYDGNKRIGMATALTFLWLNGLEVAATEDECYNASIAVATGNLSKPDLAAWLRRVCRPITP